MKNTIKFSKYQGTGNDFVLIDDRKNEFETNNAQLIAHLCDRRFGIGADGLMLLRNHIAFDFEMVYFNSDGNPSSMCGNGGRCITQFAHDLGLITNHARFIAVDGEHYAYVETNSVRLGMNNVKKVATNGGSFVLDTGSPHFVSLKKNVFGNENFIDESKAIRYNSTYKSQGINVNHIEPVGENEINARTYERGVEDETFSCGTGAVACAIAFHLSQKQEKKERIITVNTKGGVLKVAFRFGSKSIENIELIGPAAHVFNGEIDINPTNNI